MHTGLLLFCLAGGAARALTVKLNDPELFRGHRRVEVGVVKVKHGGARGGEDGEQQRTRHFVCDQRAMWPMFFNRRVSFHGKKKAPP